MLKREPIDLLRETRHLVPRILESRLAKTRLISNRTGQWSSAAKNRGVFIDMSRVEWVELGAVVQLTLLIEAALREGVDVKLALPLGRPRNSERKWQESSSVPRAGEIIRKRVELRMRVRSYLDHLRFVETLSAPHLQESAGQLDIIHEFDSGDTQLYDNVLMHAASSMTNYSDDFPTWSLSERQYKNVFPLTWFSVNDLSKINSLAWALAHVLGVPGRGLETLDAKAIANVILYELIENVSEHAQASGWAIVAAWARSEETPQLAANFLDCEQSYISWLRQRNLPVLEIIVGDSGIGLARVLKGEFELARESGVELPDNQRGGDIDILLWAFDRWSTSKKTASQRGTRGLYRVDRVVRKYQGMISLRSGKSLVGVDHGGSSYDANFYESSPLGYTPGTLLRIRMPAFREDFHPRQVLPRTPLSLMFITIELEEVGAPSLSPESREKIINAMRRTWNEGENPLCVVVTFRGFLRDPSTIEGVLRELVELRHPASLVLVGLPGGVDLLENAADSVNQECERRRLSHEGKSRKQYEVWDPVLILGDTGIEIWAGAAASGAKVLKALIVAKDAVLDRGEFRRILPGQRDRTTVLRDFRNDTNLVRWADEGKLYLLVTAQAVVRELGDLLSKHVMDRAKGVLHQAGPFRTPTLHAVRYWLNVDEILEARGVTPQVVGMSLAVLLKREEVFPGGAPVHLIVDGSVSLDRAKHIALHTGAEDFHLIPNETGNPGWQGLRLIPRGAQVVMHCDVLLSEEAAHRCLSQVLRDEAVPIALTCVFNGRGHNDPIELWGVQVPVVSIASIEMLDNQAMEMPGLSAINPVTKRVEEELAHAAEGYYEIPHRRLWALLTDNHSLHFSHIKRPSGRHFTFFVDGRQLAVNSEILEAYERVIREWFYKEGEQGLEGMKIDLCYPASEPKTDAPEKQIAEWLFARHSSVFFPPRAIPRETAYGQWIFAGGHVQRPRSELVLTVDWGALTGRSLMQFVRLAAEGGARRVLCVVCISQLPRDDEEFFKAVSSLRVRERPLKSMQIALPGFEAPNSQLEGFANVDIEVRFLGSLSLSAYDVHSCPVCLQLLRLSEEEFPTSLLERFAADQKLRLRHRGPDEVLGDRPLDLDGRVLSAEMVVWMVAFRMRLNMALTSTSRRWIVRCEILDLHTNTVSRAGEIVPEALWLLQYLSVESQWLRRPPLQFREARRLVAEIALVIAEDSRVDEVDRINAVVVLRTASKSIFARELVSIFMSALGSERLLRQILYDVYTYSSRPYHQTPGILQPLRAALSTLLHRASSGEISVASPMTLTVRNLLERVERECARVEAQTLTPIEAWRNLRRVFDQDYTGRHGTVVGRMANIVPWEGLSQAIEEAIVAQEQARELPVNFNRYVLKWIKSLHDNWVTCRQFMDWSVLPLIRPMRDIFQSNEAKQHFGEASAAKLLASAFSKELFSEGVFSNLINELSDKPEAILDRRKWDIFRTESLWLWRVVFCAGPEYGPSQLVEWLTSCPVNFYNLIESTYQEFGSWNGIVRLRKISADSDRARLEVFCTKNLLTDCMRQVFENCEKHRIDKDAGSEVEIYLARKGARIEARILNDNTGIGVDKEPGRGLEKLRERLESFRVELVASSSRTSEAWATFEVTLLLSVWE